MSKLLPSKIYPYSHVAEALLLRVYTRWNPMSDSVYRATRAYTSANGSGRAAHTRRLSQSMVGGVGRGDDSDPDDPAY